jgi:hypothetical protein
LKLRRESWAFPNVNWTALSAGRALSMFNKVGVANTRQKVIHALVSVWLKDDECVDGVAFTWLVCVITRFS